MTPKRLGLSAGVFAADAALLLFVGAAMWSEAPTAADEAVGKGLVALGGALAVPAFVLLLALLDALGLPRSDVQIVRSDRDDA